MFNLIDFRGRVLSGINQNLARHGVWLATQGWMLRVDYSTTGIQDKDMSLQRMENKKMHMSDFWSSLCLHFFVSLCNAVFLLLRIHVPFNVPPLGYIPRTQSFRWPQPMTSVRSPPRPIRTLRAAEHLIPGLRIHVERPMMMRTTASSATGSVLLPVETTEDADQRE
jgi:hypothetical protein